MNSRNLFMRGLRPGVSSPGLQAQQGPGLMMAGGPEPRDFAAKMAQGPYTGGGFSSDTGMPGFMGSPTPDITGGTLANWFGQGNPAYPQAPTWQGGSPGTQPQPGVGGGYGPSQGADPWGAAGQMPPQQMPMPQQTPNSFQDNNLDGIDDRLFQAKQQGVQANAQAEMGQLQAQRQEQYWQNTRDQAVQQRQQREMMTKQRAMTTPMGQAGTQFRGLQDTRRGLLGRGVPRMNAPLAGMGQQQKPGSGTSNMGF